MDFPPPEVVAAAKPQGINFAAGPEHLRLPVLGHEGVLEVLRRLPRDATVMVLSKITIMLSGFGESNGAVQAQAAHSWLEGASRARALEWLDRCDGIGVVFTYEAGVRLALLAMRHCDATVARQLDAAEYRLVASLMPEVQTWVSRLDTVDAPGRVPHSDEDREDTAYTLFLAANAPGMGSSPQIMLGAATVGSVAARHVDGQLRGRVGHKVRAVLRERLGSGSVEEIHAAALFLTDHFAYHEGVAEQGREPNSTLDAASLRAHNNRLGDMGEKLLSGITADPACAAEVTVQTALGPKPSLPKQLRWRPLYRGPSMGDLHACWDVRTVHAILGGRFPEWLLAFLDDEPGVVHQLGRAWDHAVEEGLDELLRPVFDTWSRLPRIKGNGGKSPPCCDRWFTEGDDLFLVEIKNIRPADAFAKGAPRDFKNWLRSKFFDQQGFAQIDASAAALDQRGVRLGGRLVREYRAIRPVVLSWVRMPGHPHITDLLDRLQAEFDRPVAADLLSRVRPPQIVDFDTFLDVASQMNAVRARGHLLGQVMDRYRELRAERPFTLAHFVKRVTPPSPFHPAMLKVINSAITRVREVGESLKVPP